MDGSEESEKVMEIKKVVMDRIKNIEDMLNDIDPQRDPSFYSDLDKSLLQWVSMALAIEQEKR